MAQISVYVINKHGKTTLKRDIEFPGGGIIHDCAVVSVLLCFTYTGFTEDVLFRLKTMSFSCACRSWLTTRTTRSLGNISGMWTITHDISMLTFHKVLRRGVPGVVWCHSTQQERPRSMVQVQELHVYPHRRQLGGRREDVYTNPQLPSCADADPVSASSYFDSSVASHNAFSFLRKTRIPQLFGIVLTTCSFAPWREPKAERCDRQLC